MTFDEYQKRSRVTARYPDLDGQPFIYPTLGLAGEAGEVVDKLKKVVRDKNGEITTETQEELRKELGDVLWYLSQIATELDISLGDIAEANISKLLSRQERGVIGGSGDNR